MKLIGLVFIIANCNLVCDTALPIVFVDDPPTVQSVADVESLPQKTKAVMVELKDANTLVVLAERFPELESLSIRYRANGQMPKGAIAELVRFKKLKKLVLRGDPVISDDEVEAIAQIHSLKSLTMALP